MNLLKEYQDIFACTYEEMPGLDERLVTHHLHIKSGSKPIKQSPRKFMHDVEEKIKTEIQKLLTAGFIKPIHHTTCLKNAGATYQRTMTVIFHDMMHKQVEDYVYDVVVKSKTRASHTDVLRQVFERYREYKLKMNPLKCAFGVSSGNVLGFQVTSEGIKVDPTKTQAIITMPPPQTVRELQSFMGKLVLISRDDPIEFLLSKPALIARPTKWLLQTSEFDITCSPPKAIKGKKVADLLAAFRREGTTALHEDLPGEFPEISFIKEETGIIYFDGSATPSNNTGGAGIVLVSPTGEVFLHSFKLDFQCTNNLAEYEAFLIGLSLAKQAGSTHLEVRGDSKLLVNQMNEVYSLKEVTLAPYVSEAQKLLNYFADATITQIGRNRNKHADCLDTLTSKLQLEGLEETLIIRRRNVASTWLTQSKDTETDDWRTPIVQDLNNSLSQGKVSLKTLQNFFMLHGVLYCRNPDGSLSRCLGYEEAQLQLNHIHNEI
ncbi:uncharacterized protein LOC113291452 [Papaver somniferum]|uniref:uncharacterized protein LOC113291452 n=1 Tax=Papaver somniferum TaxID=3469 RepID=UPI000E701FDC|nr:uncharacterized protein LOC113291452 [Papaver somniferum]